MTMKFSLSFSYKELTTVLAALRNFQEMIPETRLEAFPDHFSDVDPLSDSEIEALCQKINFTPRERD